MVFASDIREGIRIRARCIRSRLRFAAATFFAVAVLAVSPATLAGNLDKVFLFNIGAQTLDKALLEFGAQVSMQLSFAPDSVTTGLKAQELKGRYTGKEALEKLLRGTSLWYVAHRQTISILPATSLRTLKLSPSDGESNTQLRDVKKDRKISGELPPDPPAKQSRSNKETLPLVVVTGSRLLTTSKEGPQEVQIYDRVKIDQSGQNTIEDFLSTLPSVSLNTLPSNNGYSTTVQLRGLPQGTTLVLLDGRPLENSGLGGGAYFDLNDIPLAAVQRIEVDENGSSAVYGSGAIAGVVNIILKKDFNGFATSARYGWAKDYRTWLTNVAIGRQWDRAGISLVGSYETNSGLTNTDRLLTASNDYTRFGGPQNNLPLCFPGTVFSPNGAPLPGAPAGSGATYAAVSGATSGRPSFSDFTYGKLNNECAPLTPYSIISHMRRASVLIQGHLEIARNVQVFSELMYANINQNNPETYPTLFGIPGFQQFKVSASNPYNPFGESVGIADAVAIDPAPSYILNTDFFRPLVGLRGTLDEQWQWEMAIWQSVDWTKNTQQDLIAKNASIQAALNSSNPATALNPFVSGPIGSPALLQSLFSTSTAKFMGRDRAAEAFLRGPVLRLPGGPVTAVIGAQYDQSSLYVNELHYFANFFVSSHNRSRYAVFGETRIPVIGHGDDSSGHSILALTMSGRDDHYSDFGRSNTGQFGVEFTPLTGLLFRGTYSHAFDAPSLQQLFGPQLVIRSFVTDPNAGTRTLVPVTEITGGNPDLHPLTGRSKSLGIVYSPPAASGATLAATAWNVVEGSVIQSVPAQVLVQNQTLFPSRVIRNATGQLVEVIDTELNFGSFDVAGLDYQLNFHHDAGPGVLSADLDITETYRYRQVLAPGQPAVEAVSKAQTDGDWAPRWKGIIGLGWEDTDLKAHIDGRYTGAYQDYGSTQRLGNFWIFNASVRLDFGKALDLRCRWLRKAYFDVGSTNLFNRGPQFSNYGSDFFGFDGSQALANLLGRSFYVDIGANW